MKKILSYTKKYLPFLILTPIVLIVEVVLEVNIPTVAADIIDIAIPSGDSSLIASYGGKLILMALCSLLAGCVGVCCSSYGSVGFGSQLRKAVYDSIQKFSFDDIDKFKQSSLITRLTTDIDYIQQGLRMTLTMLIRAPFMMIAAAMMAYGINSDLFKVFLVATPLVLVLMVLVAVFAMGSFRLMLSKFDSLNDKAKEYLTNVRVVKSFVREKHETEKFAITNKELMDASIKIEGLLMFLMPLISLIAYGCNMAIYYFGGQQVMLGSMQIGQLTAFVSYVGQILTGLIMAAMIFINFVRLKGSVDRVKEVLNTRSTIIDGLYEGKVEKGEIEFKNVCFRYDGASKDCLANANFKIKAGEMIGIIGSTGSGKTTLVQLIDRLYDVTSGEILIDNVNVKDYKLANLRNSVGMVLQKNVLFSGSIKDNLLWGDIDASEQEIKEACQIAQADEFIMTFPNGYDTDLGQGGVNVSGGQKQRLCIARTLLKKPKIIILDDSTSAVDTYTDSTIREGLRNKLKGTTTIIIAQRISSVMDADRVMVIDNGKIVAFDRPAVLEKENEIYKDIYQTQMKGVEA